MRVAHVGNVANIAYLNVKFLRRLGGDAHLYYYDFDLCLAQPEWEDAVVEGECDVLDRDWRAKVVIREFQRPDWAHPINMTPRRMGLHVRIPFANRSRQGMRRLLGSWESWVNRVLPTWRQHRTVTKALQRREVDIHLSPLDTVRHFDIYRFREIVQGYDLVQAYGLEPIACLADFPRRPFVAYEFGTMREIPFENSVRGRLLAAAYRQAERVVITNPDVLPAAERLGVDNWVFIPHPVDESRYAPGPSAARAELEAKYGRDVRVVFAPARHDWAVKGNDRMIRAVAEVMRQERLPVVLVLTRWGEDMEKSCALICEEGIEGRVVWKPLLPKRSMLEQYLAADVVLDQFVLGTFGLVTAEAMACAKPVVLHLDPEIHEGLFPEIPPVVSAREEEDIALCLRDLLREPLRREAIGQEARQWVCRHHGWRTVAHKHLELYKAIMGRPVLSKVGGRGIVF